MFGTGETRKRFCLQQLSRKKTGKDSDMKNKLSLACLICAGALTFGGSAFAQEQTGAAGKSVLFVENEAKWAKGNTPQIKKQLEEAGWKFELATPERIMKENHPVYLFSFASLDLQKGRYCDIWETLWKQVSSCIIRVSTLLFIPMYIYNIPISLFSTNINITFKITTIF